jgi:hypothetical protein
MRGEVKKLLQILGENRSWKLLRRLRRCDKILRLFMSAILGSKLSWIRFSFRDLMDKVHVVIEKLRGFGL